MRILDNIEYTTKEMIAYNILAFKELRERDERHIDEYYKCLKRILNYITKDNALKLTRIDDCQNRQVYNWKELIHYSIVMFYSLTNYDRKINIEDIPKEMITTVTFYTTRKAEEKFYDILENHNYKYII